MNRLDCPDHVAALASYAMAPPGPGASHQFGREPCTCGPRCRVCLTARTLYEVDQSPEDSVRYLDLARQAVQLETGIPL